ncbi:hypothetical protein [Candidatus Fukatsuia endosymbiont of Tuberolachnus salignus]|uniref:hypothetical protein n=1 Tax=Candidatus Fukatsuia endosymbiont of Tuberolachnus salignus TaxID=3077957 RepID=UPI00313E0876
MKTLTSFLGIKVKEKKQDKSKLVAESNAEGRNSNNPLAAASTTSPNSMAGVDENNTRLLAIFSNMLQNPTQLGSTLEIITRLLPDNVQVKELLAFIPTIHSAPREIEDYLQTQLNDIFKDIILPRITSTQWQEIIPQLNGAPRDEAAIRDRIVTIILDSLPTWLNQPLIPLEIVHKEGTWQVNRCFTQQDSGSTVNFPTQSGQFIEARVLFENEQFRLQLSGVNPEEHLTGVTLQPPLLTTPYPIEMIENGQEEKPSRIGQKFILRPRKGGGYNLQSPLELPQLNPSREKPL